MVCLYLILDFWPLEIAVQEYISVVLSCLLMYIVTEALGGPVQPRNCLGDNCWALRPWLRMCLSCHWHLNRLLCTSDPSPEKKGASCSVGPHLAFSGDNRSTAHQCWVAEANSYSYKCFWEESAISTNSYRVLKDLGFGIHLTASFFLFVWLIGFCFVYFLFESWFLCVDLAAMELTL